jgi:hypothetical protein
MADANKKEANKGAVLGELQLLEQNLNKEPPAAPVTEALEQCQRLRLAIQQFHAEGVRFAAFTLLHMLQRRGTVFSESVQKATRDLKAALEAAGYPH